MFELMIGEYEDTQSLGEFATRDEALRTLGQYVLDHPEAGPLHPFIGQPADDEDGCEGHESLNGPIGNVEFCDAAAAAFLFRARWANARAATIAALDRAVGIR